MCIFDYICLLWVWDEIAILHRTAKWDNSTEKWAIFRGFNLFQYERLSVRTAPTTNAVSSTPRPVNFYKSAAYPNHQNLVQMAATLIALSSGCKTDFWSGHKGHLERVKSINKIKRREKLDWGRQDTCAIKSLLNISI